MLCNKLCCDITIRLVTINFQSCIRYSVTLYKPVPVIAVETFLFLLPYQLLVMVCVCYTPIREIAHFMNWPYYSCPHHELSDSFCSFSAQFVNWAKI
jgi:hypothetical protein